MRKAVFLAVLVVMVFMTLSPIWAAGTVGQVTGPDDNLSKRRIELDTNRMSVQGNGAYWIREHLAAIIRIRARNTNIVEIAVTGRQFEVIANSQDRIDLSGRYSKKSREQVQVGKMVAPTDHYRVSVIATTTRKDRGGSFSIGGRRIRASDTKLRAFVTLNIEPIDIQSGLTGHSYEAKGEAQKSVNKSLSGGSMFGQDISVGSSSGYGMEDEVEVLKEAASKAVDSFIRQLKKEAPKMPAR